MNKLLLVDGNSILNRAFYGLPDLTTKDGRHTNAVLGFLNIILRVIEEEKATHLCVAFDVKHPTFRHEMYSEYKGNRKGMPDELREQVPLIKQVLNSMNITIIERPGYEADDILGTLSRIGEGQGYVVTLLSGDRDLLQLATDKIKVKLPKTKAGKTIIEEYFASNVEETYGVDPITFIDMKGLMGDTSDNIPGVPKIGEKTAAKLLADYGSLDGIYQNIDSMKASKMKDNLVEFKDLAYLSRTLATIKLDCELDVDINKAQLNNMFNQDSFDLFAELEFKSLLKRFEDDMLVKEFDFTTEVIEDFDSYQQLITRINKNKHFGFSLAEADGEAIGATICIDDDKTYYIPFINFITKEMVVSDTIKAIRSNVVCCFMDIKSHLKFLPLKEEDSVFDCSIAAYLLNPLKSSYGYENIAGDYLGITVNSAKDLVGKTDINMFTVNEPNILKHFGLMTIIPYMAMEKLIDELKSKNMYQLYKNIELPCVYSLYDMEKYGIKVNKDELIAFGKKLEDGINKLVSQIYDMAGKEFNINSTKQLGEVLFEDLGLKSGKKTKTGYSTSVEVLEKLSNQHPIIPLILEYRTLTKLNSTYVVGMLPYIREDGRIHGKFNHTVTATGRISSTDPNLQNIPTRTQLGREIRKVFVPEEGYVFLDADYSQIELRVLAHFSDDETLINAYNKDSDIHSITASEVFDVPMDQVDSLMRRRAKAVNFGIVYGISSFGLGQDLDISRKEAEGYITKYFETYKGVKTYLDNTVTAAKEKGYVETIFNRRRPVPELSSSNFMTRSFGERVAMNSPIQGTAADIIKIAMINVNKKLKALDLKSRLILQVHDELIIETAIDEKEQVKELLVQEMMEAAKLKVKLVVDVNEGSSWYDAK
ncbi:MAG: DNA polymerase I [Lachnospiraceae bacterium]|nr:DNA polymerase I [Lachnospiraceae bacterium]MBQ8318461.1 DNA polymerase I [Lachnospiraceae bacterium]